MRESPRNPAIVASPVPVALRTFEDELPAKRFHQSSDIQVSSTLHNGAMPKLEFSWGIAAKQRNCTLLVFRNVGGFCPLEDPDDLGVHGQLIIETTQGGSHSLFMSEGTHFFTFVLQKRGLFSRYFELRSKPLRFSVEVPSAKLALERIKDGITFGDLQHQTKINPIAQHTEINDAKVDRIASRRRLNTAKYPPPKNPQEQTHADPTIASAFSTIDTFVNAVVGKKMKRREVENSPAFQELSAEEQKTILKKIDEQFHPGEISARRERSRY